LFRAKNQLGYYLVIRLKLLCGTVSQTRAFGWLC